MSWTLKWRKRKMHLLLWTNRSEENVPLGTLVGNHCIAMKLVLRHRLLHFNRYFSWHDHVRASAVSCLRLCLLHIGPPQPHASSPSRHSYWDFYNVVTMLRRHFEPSRVRNMLAFIAAFNRADRQLQSPFYRCAYHIRLY